MSLAKEERRLRGEIVLAAAGAADAAEDARLGAAVRGDELPAELRRREDRLAAIRAAKSRLEAQQRAADDARGRQPDQDRNPKGGQPYKRSYGEPDAKAQSNFTDPESGIMKTSNDGFQQCYNAQVAVDGAHQLVVATEVTANASDQGGVPALLEARRSASSRRRCWRSRLQQRAGLGGPGNARHRRVCVLGPGGEGGQAPRPGEVSRDESHGREAVEAGGPCGVCRTQVCRRLPTAGSSTCGIRRFACGGWRRCRASGTWCAWR